MDRELEQAAIQNFAQQNTAHHSQLPRELNPSPTNRRYVSAMAVARSVPPTQPNFAASVAGNFAQRMPPVYDPTFNANPAEAPVLNNVEFCKPTLHFLRNGFAQDGVDVHVNHFAVHVPLEVVANFCST